MLIKIRFTNQRNCFLERTNYFHLFFLFTFFATARDLEPLSFLNQLGLCKKDELEGVKTSGKCAPDDYVFTIKISENYCTWWRDCKLAEGAKSFVEPCDNMKHLFNSMVCYTVRCP